MGSVVGEKVTRAAELALASAHAAGRLLRLRRRADAGGRALAACRWPRPPPRSAGWREAGVPYVSLLTDPTYGGVSASFATLGDLIIGRAGRPGRLRRPAGHRADHPAEAAGGLPDRRVPDGERADRPRSCRAPSCTRCFSRLLAFHAAARARRAAAPPPTARRARRGGRPRRATRGSRVAARPPPAAPDLREDYIDRAVRRTSSSCTATGTCGDDAGRSSAAWPGSTARPVVVVGHQKGRGTRDAHRPQLRHAAPGGLPQGPPADAVRAAPRGCRW